MSLIRKTIDSLTLTSSAAEGYYFTAVFLEVDLTFQSIDLKKDLWLRIVDQAVAVRGQAYPAQGLLDELVGVKLVFEKRTPTSPPEFVAIEFDDVAALTAAIAALL